MGRSPFAVILPQTIHAPAKEAEAEGISPLTLAVRRHYVKLLQAVRLRLLTNLGTIGGLPAGLSLNGIAAN